MRVSVIDDFSSISVLKKTLLIIFLLNIFVDHCVGYLMLIVNRNRATNRGTRKILLYLSVSDWLKFSEKKFNQKKKKDARIIQVIQLTSIAE